MNQDNKDDVSINECTPSTGDSELVLPAVAQNEGDNAADMDVSMDVSMDANSPLPTDSSDSCSSSEEDFSNAQTLNESLEKRIGSVANCVHCVQSPISPYYQCAQGHLLCGSCYAAILSNEAVGVARGKCPRCSVLIIDSVHNPLAEILCKQKSKQCYYCGLYFLGYMLKDHQKKCMKRLSKCPYSLIGCTWEGYRDQLDNHKNQCEKQNLTGSEIIEFISKPKEEQLKIKQDVENFLCEMPEFQAKMIFKPPLGNHLISDSHFLAGTFRGNGFKWLIDIVWRPNDEAFNNISTISYRLKLVSTIKDEIVQLKYFVVKGAYRDEDFNVQVNNVTFSAQQLVSPDSVFIRNSAEYCERLLRNSGIYIRICFV